MENCYWNTTSLNHTGPQATINIPQNKQFNHRRFCKLRYEIKTLKKMGYEMTLDKR